MCGNYVTFNHEWLGKISREFLINVFTCIYVTLFTTTSVVDKQMCKNPDPLVNTC